MEKGKKEVKPADVIAFLKELNDIDLNYYRCIIDGLKAEKILVNFEW